MQNLIPLLLSADYATDENGFLYKMRSGKYRPLRPEMPRFSNPDNDRLMQDAATVLSRIPKAVEELRDMIDGGEECRGRDSQISEVIRILEGA